MENRRITSLTIKAREHVESGREKLEASTNYIPEYYFEIPEKHPEAV